MRRFVIKLLLALFPFILYIMVFIIYEPYNYYGIKDVYSGNWTKPLARIREYMRHPSENVILGDSRMVQIDPEIIYENTSDYYVNLSTGGQGINLTEELFEWANEKYPIKKLITDVSFWQLREGNSSESAKEVFYIAEHPLEYPFKWSYVTEAWECAKSAWGWESTVYGQEISSETNEIEAALMQNVKYPDEFVKYALENIYPLTATYKLSEGAMQSVENMINIIHANGGEAKVLIPCVQESIWEYVLLPLEMQNTLDQYKEELSQFVELYDMEWQNEISFHQEYFQDGFHFKNSYYYNEFYTKAIFNPDNENVRIWKK